MVVENRRGARGRRLAPGQVPDPLGAHGAWVYLAVSILAGTFAAADRGHLSALLAGSAFIGVFVLAGSAAVGARQGVLPRVVLGVLLTIGSLHLALELEADRSFLIVGLLAIPPALVAAWFAGREGFLSPGALAFGVTVLVVSAPVAATAGGASPRRALTVLAILAPFFFWRTWRLARALGPGWTKARFQRRGLLESALALAWGALAVAVLRMLG